MCLGSACEPPATTCRIVPSYCATSSSIHCWLAEYVGFNGNPMSAILLVVMPIIEIIQSEELFTYTPPLAFLRLQSIPDAYTKRCVWLAGSGPPVTFSSSGDKYNPLPACFDGEMFRPLSKIELTECRCLFTMISSLGVDENPLPLPSGGRKDHTIRTLHQFGAQP